MRRRYAIVGLLFTVAVAIFAVPIIVPAPGARDVSPPARQESRYSAAAKEEHAEKLDTIKRDMETTGMLCRIECSSDMRKLAAAASKSGSATLSEARKKAFMKDMLAANPHFEAMAWTSAPSGSSGSSEAAVGAKMERYDPTVRQAWQEGMSAVRQGRSFESAALPIHGDSGYVLAVPAGGGGLVALIHADAIDEVGKHQRRNLRLVPYPDNSRFRTQATEPGRLKDKQVTSGDANGNASHYAVDEVVVKLRRQLTPRELLQLRKTLNLTVAREHRRQTYVFRSKTLRTAQLIDYFKKNWNPVFAEPHYLYLTNDGKPAGRPAPLGAGSPLQTDVVPNDTLYGQYQWNLPEIATERGWNVTRGKQDIVVAVVDTGVQLDHPDLKGRLVAGTNIVDPSAPPEDDVGHGTHVAGIIAAEVNNNEGVAGMTWYTKVMPVKALDNSGAGTTYSVAEGIIWAADHGAQVINLSLGNYAEAQFLHDAIKYAHDKGVIVVAASGNDNTDRPGYPAAYPEVVAVGATGSDELRAPYSNYGDYIDVAAPGTSIASTYPGSRYAALSGTSMAAPHVSALASLMLAADGSLTNDRIAELLGKTARDLGAAGKDTEFGYGQIDVRGAVEAAAGKSAAPAANKQAAVADTQNAGQADIVQQRLLVRLQNLLSNLLGR
ncbi:Serine protease, subtilisin family [Cohnella sp. OV330]|uniref:S8 family peptidase n=1 Tax=Cohnella sp. OV330 TaxID=1855288 RepID=UPI0008E61938|nr:S8 family peptidase [Cohnella sp. OV330]SFB35568.1 Serine protease, subtilisin family [Cohnella sp. OV330]